MILYHKSNLFYTVVFSQFLIFQKNNSDYYFFEKLKIVEKQVCKLNCSYGKVSQTLKAVYQALYQPILFGEINHKIIILKKIPYQTNVKN